MIWMEKDKLLYHMVANQTFLNGMIRWREKRKELHGFQFFAPLDPSSELLQIPFVFA